MENKTELVIPMPHATQNEGSTVKVSGEAETFFGTKFYYVICFTGAAVENLEAPPKPNLRPKIKPLRLSVNKRFKALYARVGPEKIEFTEEKSKEKDKLTINICNTEVDLEQMIFDASRM